MTVHCRTAFLLMLAAVSSLFVPPALAVDRIAVLDLRAEDPRVEAADVAQISIELRTQIVNLGRRQGGFTCLDRHEMEARLKEQAFSLTDCVSDECVLDAGRALTAKKMVAGQVGKVGRMFVISARLLDVESGEIVSATTVRISGEIEEVFDRGVPQVVRELFYVKPVPSPVREPSLKTRGGALLRSAVLPGWGQFYRGSSGRGTLMAVAAAASLGGSIYAISDYNKKTDDYDAYRVATNPDPERLRTLHDDAGKAADLGNIMIAVTGVLWAVNLADAYWGFGGGDRGLALTVSPGQAPVFGVVARLPW